MSARMGLQRDGHQLGLIQLQTAPALDHTFWGMSIPDAESIS